MIRALEAGQDIGLPASVHVIGLPALPPLYVGLLQQLGRWMDVHVYALNPCRAYWFEVVSGRRLSWLASRGEAALHEQGHRLLADWGRQSQAFLASLVNFDGEAVIDDAGFEASAGDSLLAALQNSILELEELAPTSIALPASDRSVEVHVCHSATRELEVLQDVLLGLFAADKALSPADILVVTPDLQAMAPLIQAVFGAAPAARRIPFTVTGLPERESNPYSRLLLDAARVHPLALRRDRTVRVAAARGGGAALRARRRRPRGHPGVDAGRGHALGARWPAPIPVRRAGFRQAQPGRRAAAAVPRLCVACKPRRRRSSTACRLQGPRARRRVPWVPCGRWSTR